MTRSPEAVARLFHETYERLAPEFGYRTREASAKPWDEVPEQNRALMVATVREVLAALDSSDDPRAENLRLHAEIRSLNGQIEGLTRVMAGLHARLDRTVRENEELKAERAAP